uniref:ribonuclease H n=1 Tax=Strongyloides papillosus TaxID=174720 RepID=A0A0N5CHX9_STREA
MNVSNIRLLFNSILKQNSITKIYIDGSFRQDLKCKSNAGIGVYWGDNDSRNISLKLVGNHTSSTTELNAALYALRQVKKLKIENAHIYSDSIYVVNSVNDWVHKWKENGWLTYGKKDVKHKELMIELNNLIEITGAKFYHVKGHSKHYGNEQAHDLAFKASQNDT